jgi:lysyl-tRNA synthetase class II
MKTKPFILILAAALSLASCNDKKAEENNEGAAATEEIDKTAVASDTLTPNVDTEAPVTVTINGKVADITMGKDGYTAHITDDSGRDYYATISRVNLHDPAQYKEVKAGDKITVKGESFKLEDKLHIKVHELK